MLFSHCCSFSTVCIFFSAHFFYRCHSLHCVFFWLFCSLWWFVLRRGDLCCVVVIGGDFRRFVVVLVSPLCKLGNVKVSWSICIGIWTRGLVYKFVRKFLTSLAMAAQAQLNVLFGFPWKVPVATNIGNLSSQQFKFGIFHNHAYHFNPTCRFCLMLLKWYSLCTFITLSLSLLSLYIFILLSFTFSLSFSVSVMCFPVLWPVVWWRLLACGGIWRAAASLDIQHSIL